MTDADPREYRAPLSKPYVELDDNMKKAILLNQSVMAKAIAHEINEAPNMFGNCRILPLLWFLGGPDCPIMKKFYPCEVAEKLLKEHPELKSKSNVFTMI